MLCEQTALSLENIVFRYEPFPIGFVPEVLDRGRISWSGSPRRLQREAGPYRRLVFPSGLDH